MLINCGLFVTVDGGSGIALNEDEIVSAFSCRDSKYPGAARFLLAVAVQQGGQRLDCFDTVLPRIYKWGDDFAPDGWNYDVYNRYGGGTSGRCVYGL